MTRARTSVALALAFFAVGLGSAAGASHHTALGLALCLFGPLSPQFGAGSGREDRQQGV